MSSLLNGDIICKVVNFFSGMYVAGSYTWGCSIAFFRVIFITAQGFLKGRVEERSLLNVLLLCGLTLVLYYSVTSLLFDDEVPTYKMCTHQSHEDRKIIRFYQVKKVLDLVQLFFFPIVSSGGQGCLKLLTKL